MNRMKEIVTTLSVRLEGLSLRERVVILLAVIAVVYFVTHIIVLGVLERRRDLLRDKITIADDRITQMTQALTELERQRRDPNDVLKEKIDRLENDIRDMDRQLRSRAFELVAPREVPKLLETFLKRRDRLRLVSLENHPPEPLVQREEKPQGSEDGDGKKLPNVYRHTVRLELEGTYLETLGYLEALEGISQSLFWRSIDIEVEQHPRARIVLQVYTLSLSKGWIGV